MTLDRQVDQKKNIYIYVILTITERGIFRQMGQDWVSHTSGHGPVKTSLSFCIIAFCLFSSQNNVSVSYTMKSAPVRTEIEFHSGLCKTCLCQTAVVHRKSKGDPSTLKTTVMSGDLLSVWRVFFERGGGGEIPWRKGHTLVLSGVFLFSLLLILLSFDI